MLWSGPLSFGLLAHVLGTYATPLAAPQRITPSQGILSLKRASRQPPSSRALVAKRVKTNGTVLTAVEGGQGYAVPIQFGQDMFDVFFDTGSSDLWLGSSSLKCVTPDNQPQPQEECGLSPLFNGTFSGGTIADQNFWISYGDGEFLTGDFGYQDVTFAGITVENQQVALADYGYFFGDDTYSGVLGFAYPSNVGAFTGTDPSKDNNSNAVRYNPFFFSAVDEGKVEPMFSLALNRGTEGEAGQFAFGCLPKVAYRGDFVSTPLEVYDDPNDSYTVTNFTYYMIRPDAYVLQKQYFDSNGCLASSIPSSAGNFTNSTLPNTTPAMIDSGTTVMYLPTILAAEVNAQFLPPAVYIEDQGIYEVDCDALPPTFAVRIAGQDFDVDGRDLLLTSEVGLDTETGLCITGVQPDDSGLSILGDSFLKNVVAVFDVGNVEMRFAAR